MKAKVSTVCHIIYRIHICHCAAEKARLQKEERREAADGTQKAECISEQPLQGLHSQQTRFFRTDHQAHLQQDGGLL